MFWKIILKQVKNLGIAHNEGQGKHCPSDERKKYFCLSELLGTKGQEFRKERLIIAEESSRYDPSLNEHGVHTEVEKEVDMKDSLRV